MDASRGVGRDTAGGGWEGEGWGLRCGSGAVKEPERRILINPRPDGGLLRAPPLQFFEDIEENAARSAAVFCIPYQPSFPYLS